jgi:cytochrome c peroxidase
MADATFLSGTRSQPLGDAKAGLSPELDALAAYLNSLSSPGRSPFRQTNGTLTSGASAGEAIFIELGCQSCHSGNRFSDSQTRVRHDVGTIKASSGQRAGAPLDGFDTPILLGLWASAPYLHDGSAAALRDVLTTANPDGRHGSVSTLLPVQVDQLVEYLMQLELESP